MRIDSMDERRDKAAEEEIIVKHMKKILHKLVSFSLGYCGILRLIGCTEETRVFVHEINVAEV